MFSTLALHGNSVGYVASIIGFLLMGLALASGARALLRPGRSRSEGSLVGTLRRALVILLPAAVCLTLAEFAYRGSRNLLQQDLAATVDLLAVHLDNSIQEGARVVRTLSGALRINRALQTGTETDLQEAVKVLDRYQSEGGVDACLMFDTGGVMRAAAPPSALRTTTECPSHACLQIARHRQLGIDFEPPSPQRRHTAIHLVFPATDDQNQIQGYVAAVLQSQRLESHLTGRALFVAQKSGQLLMAGQQVPGIERAVFAPAAGQATGTFSDDTGLAYLLHRHELEGDASVHVVGLISASMLAWIRITGAAVALLAVLSALLVLEVNRERQAHHASVESSERNFRNLVQDSNSLILRMDAQGDIEFANEFAARLVQQPAGALTGLSAFGLFLPARNPDGSDAREVLFRSLQAGDRPCVVAEQTLDPGVGREAWIVWTHRPLIDRDGRLTGVLSIGNDITPLKCEQQKREDLEKQILQVQKLESLGLLAGGIAHDFNNLLMGIMGNASLTLTEKQLSTSARKSLQQIEQIAARASDLTGQLLAYAGRGRFVVEPLDLAHVIEEMRDLLQLSIPRKVQLNLRLERGIPAIMGDATQIRQVVLNLVVNAAEAIGDATGMITLSVTSRLCDEGALQRTLHPGTLQPGRFLSLQVSDTGCGMTEELQQRVFEPFFTTKFTGRGLGLAAVLGIVRGHQGAIQLFSELGRGTTFDLLFPVTDRPAATRPAQTDRRQEWTGQGLILIAEDEAHVRELAERMVRTAGFEVICAPDGLQAIELFRARAGDICLALVDLVMPGKNGHEVFREIQRVRPRLPVILMSGYNEEESLSSFSDGPPAAFIQKPYRVHDLLAQIKAVLARSSAPSA